MTVTAEALALFRLSVRQIIETPELDFARRLNLLTRVLADEVYDVLTERQRIEVMRQESKRATGRYYHI